MKGMGKYAPIERALSHLTIDELNEIYLSGELDNIYEEFERTGEVRVRSFKNKKRKKMVKGE